MFDAWIKGAVRYTCENCRCMFTTYKFYRLIPDLMYSTPFKKRYIMAYSCQCTSCKWNKKYVHRLSDLTSCSIDSIEMEKEFWTLFKFPSVKFSIIEN